MSTWLFESIISIEKIAPTKRSTLNAPRYLILIWPFRQLYHQKNCTCRAIDFQIRFRWTTCSLLDLLSMPMSYDWYVNSTSEAFFSLLVWIFSQRNETPTHKRLFDWFRNSSYARLKTSWPFVHWLVNLTYLWKTSGKTLSDDDAFMNHACAVNKLSSWTIYSIVLFDELILFLRLHLEIFCDHHLMNAQSILYSLIICYEIHVKLTHFNLVERKR